MPGGLSLPVPPLSSGEGAGPETKSIANGQCLFHYTKQQNDGMTGSRLYSEAAKVHKAEETSQILVEAGGGGGEEGEGS